LRSETTAWATWADYRESERQVVEISSGGDLPTALFFPADYSVGMANLGYHYIYRKLRELGVSAERFFLSPIPYRSVEGDVMLERFPLIMAGLSYEGDVPAFARWLIGGGIEPSREGRNYSGAQIIGTGGAMTYINPLSLSDISDFIVLGDGLSALNHVIKMLRRGGKRERILAKLGEHPSILVPSIHLGQGAAFALGVAKSEDLNHDYGHGNWIAPKSVFGDAFLVELQRGCARGCRYCTLPSCFGPLRQRSVERVLCDIKNASQAVDFTRIGLVTPETSDYRSLGDLIAGTEALEKGVSFASLRVDGLSRDMIKTLARGGRRSITVAPETGDDEFRALCGKSFTNDIIIDVLEMAKGEGMSSAKLYFMIGLPGETDAHVLSIPELCGRIRKETGLRLSAGVSPFVPKPRTAWSNAVFCGELALRAKFALLSKTARGISGTTFQWGSVKEASIEYALSWATSALSKTATKLVREAQPGALKKISKQVDRDGALRELGRLGLS
jgi:radical SAM superfamily enzyme YgiQ (UPF0313 family)